MATKESILAELTCRFAELGRELGFSEPAIQNRGHQTDLYMLRKGHALQMEILWGGMVAFINVVRLYDGQLPDSYVEYTNPDGSWRKRSVYRIYGVEPVHHNYKRLPPLKTWDDMEPYYYRSLKELELIRENPDVLLQFMDHIDGGSPGLLKKIGNLFTQKENP